MRFEHEAAAVGVDERMALASVDLLSNIVTAQAAALGGLDAVAVDDAKQLGRARRSLPPSAAPLPS
jgi:hypothetical protein